MAYSIPRDSAKTATSPPEFQSKLYFVFLQSFQAFPSFEKDEGFLNQFFAVMNYPFSIGPEVQTSMVR